ncbi:MAG: SGNH/GDSL hydrolase family protein [Gemmatimonadetes bacterium]|nr:SGNH/GDSL hydrolase family protein [Gemmatimonadota bacterium]
MDKRKSGRITRFLEALSLVSIAFLLTFVCLEACCRFYITRVADEADFLMYASIDQIKARGQVDLPRYSPHRYLGYMPTPGFESGNDRHNADGCRGDEITSPKPKDEYRIVCLGGSTTYTTNPKNWQESYPAVLEAILKKRGYHNVRVINGGAASWSSWEVLINFQFRVLDLDPDMIIAYLGINDAHTRLVWPPEAYRGDNSGRRAAIHAMSRETSVLEKSSLLRMILIRLRKIKPHSDMERTLDAAPDTYYGELFQSQVLSGKYPSGIFEKVSASEMFRINRPIFFRRNLENLAAIANHHGVETVLASLILSPHFERQPRATSDEYVGAVAETNEILKEIAAEMDLHFFDFASVFPKDQKLFTDGRHVTPSGAIMKARYFADYLIDNQLLSPPGATN